MIDEDVSLASTRPLRPTFPSDLRPEVLAFAYAMEARLRAKDAELGGNSWQRGAVDLRHIAKLARTKVGMAAFEAIEGNHPGCAIKEAADAANYLLIIADLSGALETDVQRIESARAQGAVG